MAQLTRTKRAQVIRPTGIVPMTGLKEAGRSMQETAKFAESVGDYFYNQGLREAAERGMESAYETPSEREMRFLTTGDGLAVADSNGRGIEVEYVKQMPRQDAGLFNREEAVSYNKALAAKEKTDTIISTEGTLEQWYLESSETLDPESFEAKGQAYIQSVIDNAHPDIKGSVAATVQPYFQKRLNAIKVSKRESDIALAKENTKLLIQEQQNNIISGIGTHGINDRGVQDNIAVLIDLHQGMVGKDYSPEMAMSDVSNFIVNKVVKTDLVNQVKSLAEDSEGFTKGDEAIFKGRLASFLEGGYEMSIPVMKNGKISMEVMPVSQVIDGAERTRLANNAANLMNLNVQIRNTLEDIDDKFITSELSKYAAQAMLALVDGDMDSLTSAESVLLDMSSKLDNPEDSLNVLKTVISLQEKTRGLLSRKAADEKRLGNETYAATLERSMDEQINALTRMLGSNISEVQGYLLDEDDIESSIGEMPTASRVKFKNAQLSLLTSFASNLSQPKSFYETVRAVASGKAVPWNKSHADEFSRMIHLNNDMLKNEEGQWDSTEVLEKLGPHFDRGRIPSSLTQAMVEAMSRGVEDPQGMMAAYSVFDRIKRSPAIDSVTLDSMLGDNLVDALNYMRDSVYDRGLPPNSATVMNDVMAIRAGEKVKLWDSLNEQEKLAVAVHIEDEYEGAPEAMKRQIRSSVASSFKQHGDIDRAISTAVERVVGGDFGKRWGKSSYSMMGTDVWTQHPVEGNFPNIANYQDFFEKGVLKQINDTVWKQVGRNVYGGEFGFGSRESKDGGPQISLRYAGSDKAGNPQYLAIPTQVEQGNIILSDAPLMDKEGNAIVIRPAQIEAQLAGREIALGELQTQKDALQVRVDYILNNPVSAYDLDRLRDRVQTLGLFIAGLEDSQASNIEQRTEDAMEFIKSTNQEFFTKELKPL